VKTLEKILLVASLAFAAWSTYTVVTGLLNGVLCYQSHCARRNIPTEPFTGYAFMYASFAVLGFVSAWRSQKNLKNRWLRSSASNGKT
jgi:hypothetical protein